MSGPASRAPLPHGLWFEDFVLGRNFDSCGRTLTEADVVLFAGLSGDYNPMHVDEPRAERTAFRGRVAHGLLVESIASGLAMQTGIFHGTIAALLEMTIAYRLPVRAGDTISVRLTVMDREQEAGPRRGWVVFRTEVHNQRDELVLDGSWRLLMQRRRDLAARAPDEGAR
jgi:acyl dehydratase